MVGFSKKWSPAEQKHTTIEQRILVLICFLKIFCSYQEKSEIEITMDDQVQMNCFDKDKLRWRKAKWIEALKSFGIFPTALLHGQVYVIEYAPIMVSHEEKVVNNVAVPYFD